MRNITTTVVTLVLLVGTVLLQIFLSKRESKWAGLILPILYFCFAKSATHDNAVRWYDK